VPVDEQAKIGAGNTARVYHLTWQGWPSVLEEPTSASVARIEVWIITSPVITAFLTILGGGHGGNGEIQDRATCGAVMELKMRDFALASIGMTSGCRRWCGRWR
jgi:hypothetical protein